MLPKGTIMNKRLLNIIFGISLALLLVGVFPATSQDAAPSASKWSTGAPMPTPRSEIASAELGGLIYVAGGIGSGWTVRTEVERYNPAADTWETVAPLPVGLHHLGMAAANGKIYVTGGYADMNFTADQAATYAYDPAANAWTQVANMPAPRGAHAMVSIGEQLYVVGGVGPSAEKLFVYDPATDTWNDSAPTLPTPREHLAAVSLDDALYVVGGRTDHNLGTLESYAPGSEAWIPAMPEMITPRGGLTAGVIDGVIHVTGGELFDPAQTYRQHEAFNLWIGAWDTLEPMPTARHGLTSAVYEGRWYVIGGATGAEGQTADTVTGAVEIFTVRTPLPDNTRTGIPMVDAVIAAATANDSAALRDLVHYTSAACIVTPQGLGGPPICAEDEAEGTTVEVLPTLFSEGSYIRRADIDLAFPPASYNLYAVYQVSADAVQEVYFPAGEYGVVFIDESQDLFNTVTLRVTSEGIVRIDYNAWPNALLGGGIGEFILPPVVPLARGE
jgi:hypothetical protein